jgi:hypothetical protein
MERPLTEEEKYQVLKNEKVPKEVLLYLKERLQELTITKNYEKKRGNILELMPQGALNGWCWETTEAASLFFHDEDCIKRGLLKVDEHQDRDYHHAWIKFSYENEQYVFDPCLNLICKEKNYNRIYAANIVSSIPAKAVKEAVITYIKNKPVLPISRADQFIAKLEGVSIEQYQKEQEKEIYIYGDNNISSPLFRNTATYEVELENEKIKKLVAHYFIVGY